MNRKQENKIREAANALWAVFTHTWFWAMNEEYEFTYDQAVKSLKAAQAHAKKTGKGQILGDITDEFIAEDDEELKGVSNAYLHIQPTAGIILSFDYRGRRYELTPAFYQDTFGEDAYWLSLKDNGAANV
jgi:hypothetical protein